MEANVCGRCNRLFDSFEDLMEHMNLRDIDLCECVPDKTKDEIITELLQACRHYLYQYDSVHHGNDIGETPRKIRKAILKAEGKL